MMGENQNIQVLAKLADQATESFYIFKAPECKHSVDHSSLEMASLFYGKCSECITDSDKGETFYAIFDQQCSIPGYRIYKPEEPSNILSLNQLPEIENPTWYIFRAPECRHRADHDELDDGSYFYGNCATCADDPEKGNGSIYYAIFDEQCSIPGSQKYYPSRPRIGLD